MLHWITLYASLFGKRYYRDTPLTTTTTMALPFTSPKGPLRYESSVDEKENQLNDVDGIEDIPEIFERHRTLEDGGSSSVYVDHNGNEYEPYSMGWRYLGMYIDCQTSDYGTRRNLNSGSGSGDGDEACARKLLWAAVSHIS